MGEGDHEIRPATELPNGLRFGFRAMDARDSRVSPQGGVAKDDPCRDQGYFFRVAIANPRHSDDVFRKTSVGDLRPKLVTFIC